MAISYCVRQNLKQFKLHPCLKNSKYPATYNGFKDALSGQDISDFIKQGLNIGLACALSKLIVIDADVDAERNFNGIQTIKELEKELGPLPLTLTQETPRGGRHFIFSDEGIINPIIKIGKDVDIKHNGYILCWPSSIDNKFYRFIEGIEDNGDFIISKLPEKWIAYLNKNNLSKISSSKLRKPKKFKNVNIDALFKNCNFLKHCRDNAETLSEPEWHAMICSLTPMESCEELIHELSAPYPNYSFEETQKKIDNAQKFGYPTSCNYISSLCPDVCISCNQNRKEI